MSRPEAFRGASYAPFLPTKSQPHGDARDTMTTGIDEDGFRRVRRRGGGGGGAHDPTD